MDGQRISGTETLLRPSFGRGDQTPSCNEQVVLTRMTLTIFQHLAARKWLLHVRNRPEADVITTKIKQEHQRMSKPWFGPRKFGFGWTPVSWEGWICTFLVVAVFTG